MSNGSIEFWTVFLWLFYIRLLTIRLVTQVDGGELIVRMKGLFRKRRIPISSIRSAEVIAFDPFRDYGGFGIRSTRAEKAYIAQGNQGVRITLDDGKAVVVGSQKSAELKAVLDQSPLPHDRGFR